VFDSKSRLIDPNTRKEFTQKRFRQEGHRILGITPDGGVATETCAVLVERNGVSFHTVESERLRRLTLWELPGRTERARFDTHMEHIDEVGFTPDGTLVAALGSRTDGLIQAGIVEAIEVGVVEWWDVRSGRIRATVQMKPAGKWAGPPVFAPDGAALAAVDEAGLRVWDADTGLEKFTLAGVSAAAFLPDGRSLATASGGSVSLYDPATGARTELFTRPTSVRSLTLAPGGRWLAAECEDGVGTLYDLSGASPLRTGPTTGRPAFAPDGRTAATFEDHTVTLWQLATQQELLTLEAPGWSLKAVAFSADGKALIGLGQHPRDPIQDVVIWPAAPEKAAPPD
jgi:WD40 repeat protein